MIDVVAVPFLQHHLLSVYAGVVIEVLRHWITNRPRFHCYPGSEIQMVVFKIKGYFVLKTNKRKNWGCEFQTSMALPMVWIILSKMLVRSTSNDLHCKRHLYMMQAAIGLFPAKPRCCAMHRMSSSWFSCCFSFSDFCGLSSNSDSLWFIEELCRSWSI